MYHKITLTTEATMEILHVANGQVENEIYEILQRLASKLYAGKVPDRQWTVDIKTELEALGREKLYAIWHSACGKGEWLFDLCWVKQKSANDWWKRFDGLALACEIEWKMSDEEIATDFLKLAVADADLRLFIFAQMHSSQAFKVIEFLKRLCPKGKQFRYMAICVPYNKPAELPFEIWIE